MTDRRDALAYKKRKNSGKALVYLLLACIGLGLAFWAFGKWFESETRPSPEKTFNTYFTTPISMVS